MQSATAQEVTALVPFGCIQYLPPPSLSGIPSFYEGTQYLAGLLAAISSFRPIIFDYLSHVLVHHSPMIRIHQQGLTQIRHGYRDKPYIPHLKLWTRQGRLS
jgi:hypothetical protein